MMELKYTPGVSNNGKQEFPMSSSGNKNSVTNKKGTTDFQKVFNDSKIKPSEEPLKSNQTAQKPIGVVQEKSDITVVDKPVVEEKDWAVDLSEEEQAKIKKAVNLLLTFMENQFPEQKIVDEEVPVEEQENLSTSEKIAVEEKAKQLAQAFSKELEITTEMTQQLVANLKDLAATSRLGAVSEEKLAAMIAQAVAPEKPVVVNALELALEKSVATPAVTPVVAPEKPVVFVGQPVTGENITIPVEQNIMTNFANPDSMSAKAAGQTAIDENIVASSIEAKNLQAKNLEQTLKNLVEKAVVAEDTVSVVTAPQIEKLSSAQMPALQSHANFIVGKLNSDAMAKDNPKTVDKVDNTVLTAVSSQPTVSMMSLQTKLGQQFSDLQNSHKNNLEQSIKPLQDSNQIKSNYADLLFPNNKSPELEKVELNLLQDRAAISRQIVDNIKVMQRNNNTEMVIRLKPEHMGEMVLRISTNAAGTISASFQTNNPEARLALESTMLALKQELAANGLKVQDVDLFGGISDFLSGQSQANKDQKSNHSGKPFAEQKEETVENIADKLGAQELTDDGNVDYRI